jgi:acylphosphatase
MNKRVYMLFSGRVQGVGFRYAAQDIGSALRINGWVKNTSDGKVEVVAEGEEATIKEFIEGLKKQMKYYISSEQILWEEPQGDLKEFHIRFY